MVSKPVKVRCSLCDCEMVAVAGRNGRGVLCAADEDQVGKLQSLAGTIRLNTELAKKPNECLEYVVVHEMAHLLEPTHNARFIALMERFMPNWRLRRDHLNQLPVRHEEWEC